MSARVISIIVALTAAAALLLAAPARTVEASSCARYHYVQQGDTLFRLSRLYGTTVAELQRLNGLGSSTRIYAGSGLCVQSGIVTDPADGGKTYIVQRGDTLSRIARRFGVDMLVLARVNNIANANRIYAGQKLSIPDFTIQ